MKLDSPRRGHPEVALSRSGFPTGQADSGRTSVGPRRYRASRREGALIRSMDFPPGVPTYRFIGLARLEVRLFPVTRLIITLPWGVATFVLLRSLAVWAGLGVALAVLVIRCLAWLFARFANWGPGHTLFAATLSTGVAALARRMPRGPGRHRSRVRSRAAGLPQRFVGGIWRRFHPHPSLRPRPYPKK